MSFRVGLKPKISDITDNPKKLKLIEIDAAQSPRALDDVDAAASLSIQKSRKANTV